MEEDWLEKKRGYLKHPVEHINLEEVKSIGDLIQAFHTSSFQSRSLAKCFDVYLRMLQDEQAGIFMGISGALVPAGMRKVIRDMIEYNLIDVIVSTGANLYHDFFEGIGNRHYVAKAKIPEEITDYELFDLEIDRFHDTLADDKEIEKAETVIAEIAGKMEQKEYSSREFLQTLGSYLNDPNSILYTAFKKGVPVFCPALSDSSIGIGLTIYYCQHRGTNNTKFNINQIRDNYEIFQIKKEIATSGVIYIGGGVPKNYIQQVEMVMWSMGHESKGHRYAIQITTDDPKWGGLSGCTLDEAVSWGKIAPEAETATAYIDATIGLPLLVGAIMQDKRIRKRKKWNFEWRGDELIRIWKSAD